MSRLEPGGATTPAEFVALLREVRDRSGLTYREIERRAEALGEVLPKSTAASMLTRDTLPRAELVSTLLKVCGEPDDASWLLARERLSGAVEAEAPVLAEEKPKRRWIWPVGGAAVVLVAVAVAVPMILGGRRSDDESHPIAAKPNPAAPAEGDYRLRAAHSGLCLSEREGSDTGVLFQKDCVRTLPRHTLDRVEDGSYRLRADHPQFGPGCLGVRKESMEVGAAVVDDECATGNAELFNVESAGANGFRLRALHSNLCVGIADGEMDEWVALRQVVCESPVSATVLTFEPLPK
ncbi:RICIN domain-containing protein [Allokutzneria sp. NRRL B-24872]|uniref:RICIN domain-containing protein n=1 Tax=Allokutzneria sp. NRRL B-24872 TaxID=1137961 RepID=UPI000A39B958|nr:RICIN domain-containing protein [Allokutzneria sp. NRRL B-24872]